MQKYIMQKSKKQRWNMGKRILAVVLAICMVCMVQPDLWNTVTVQAADCTITQDETWTSRTLEAGTYTIKPGVTVTVEGMLVVNSDVTIKGGGKLVRGASGAYFAVRGGNLTLQNIEIDGASLPSSSAMIDARSSAKVTLENGCWIHHCYKSEGMGEGAALRLDGSSAVFQEAVIENCQARNYGGAIYTNYGSSLIIHSGTYKENRTTLETAFYGGGFLYNRASKVEIYGGNFINNTSAGFGGCIYNTGVEGTETYLYGGYFQGNQSTYTEVGSGAVFYSSVNTADTIFNLSGNVQFCGDDVAGSGTDGVFLDLGAGSSARKAKISSELIYPLALYLEAQEGRVIAEGVEYTLQEKDMKKISFTDIGSSGKIWYAKLDKENNQIILTTTNPEYGMYVTYSANGGTGAISDSREYFSTETVTVKSGDSLHRDGYTFGGWNTKPDGTGTTYWADDTFQITDDVTLYAQWEENQGAAKYMVKYNKNNGTIMNESNYRRYTYGTGLTLPTPTRRGYTFGGWYDNETYEGTAVTDISATETGDKEYWAKWKDDIAPIIGTLGYSYEPVNLWQWLIGKEDLVITVPVTEEGSGADEISYTVTPEGGTASERTAAIADGKAEITVSADFKGTITIVCTDKAGNKSAGVTVGSGSDVTGIIIEDNVPQISFQVNGGDVSAEAYDAVPDITVTVSDDTDNAISAGIASVTYQIGNGEEESVQQDFTESMKTNATFTIPADKIPANGTEITVKAVDHAGNTVSAKQTVKVITDADKVAAAKIVVEDTLEDYTATNSTTKQEIQEKIDIALTNAGITDVTATVGDLTKTEATTETEGSISGSITIVSDNDSDVTDSVPIHKTIAPFHTHSYTWIITKVATADEEGEMTGTCICGEITTETIPKTGESGTETPGTPSPTPVTTETPGTPTPTPITTETPDTSTPTPVPTNTPDTATPTPGIPTATPGSTATPDQPEPGILPEEVLAKNALSLNALLKVSQTGKKINITWGQVAGADGYDVYVQYCSKKFTEKSITAVKSGKKTKVTVRKVNGKSLNLKKNYKIYILAYKLVNGKKITLGRTIIAHIVGRKNAKYTNVKAVRAKKSSYSLKQGKTAVIKASTVLVSKGKKQLSNAHAKKFRYATDNKKVATVSKKGRIKAVGKGTCTIYVYARNGYAKKIKVTVR